jgi:hypothetical protein
MFQDLQCSNMLNIEQKCSCVSPFNQEHLYYFRKYLQNKNDTPNCMGTHLCIVFVCKYILNIYYTVLHTVAYMKKSIRKNRTFFCPSGTSGQKFKN